MPANGRWDLIRRLKVKKIYAPSWFYLQGILMSSLQQPLSTHTKSNTFSNSRHNNVNNQQDATTFSFINHFNSALHVSGDKFAHPQEHFLTVYTGFGTMYRHCCRPVPRLRRNVSSDLFRSSQFPSQQHKRSSQLVTRQHQSVP